MINSKTITVIKRELRAHLLSKSFIIMTLLIPLFMFGLLAIQTLLMQYEGDEGSAIIISAVTPDILNEIRSELQEQDFVKNGYYKITYEVVPGEEIKSFIEKNKSDLVDEKLTGIIHIPAEAQKTKQIEFYSKNPKNNTLFGKVGDFINTVLINNYFRGRQLTDEEIAFAKNRIDFKELKVSRDNEIEEQGYGNMIASFLFTFLLYFSLLIFGSAMLTSVIEEKNNRIVEVLLSSVSSRDLLTGKIVGTSITGLFQMAIWLLPVIFLISTTYFVLPAELKLSIDGGQIVFFLFNFFIALLTFIGLYAAVGSIFTNVQDAQGANWPVMLLIIIPFFIALSMQSNPNSGIAKVASMVPFASLIVMPARITIMEVPLWQFILSIVVNITTFLLMFPIAGKIYRVGILSTGKKPSWGEVIKWIKYKY